MLTARARTVLLFAGGTLSAFLYLRYASPPPLIVGGEMVAVAYNLASEGSFGNPFVTGPTGPTAIVAPLYPGFLGFLVFVLGPVAGTVATVISLIVGGMHACMLPAVSRSIYGRTAPGTCAAILSIALPIGRVLPSWEAVHAAVALMAFCIGSERLLAGNQRRLGIPLVGVAAGLLALLSPGAALVGFLWIGFLLKRRPAGLREKWRALFVILTVASLTCFPWALRNKRQVGTFALKNNFGMTFYASNNNCAPSSITESLRRGCFQKHSPAGSAREVALLNSLGEGAYDHFRTTTTLRWIRANPGAFLNLTLRRIWEFWFPTADHHVYAYGVWLITALSVPGLWLMARRRVPAIQFMMCALAVYALPYYVVISDVRYRYPVAWLSLLASGYLLSEILGSKQVCDRLAILRSFRRGDKFNLGAA